MQGLGRAINRKSRGEAAMLEETLKDLSTDLTHVYFS